MRSAFILATLLAASIGAAAEAQVSCSEAELVGFTSTRYTGDFNGIFGTTDACQDRFGDNTRMCSSVEVMNTLDVPGGLSGEAWVRPVSVDGSVDASGLSSATGSNCGLWNSKSSGHSGLIVDGRGWFWVRDCSTRLAVACCAVSRAHVSPIPVGGPFSGMALLVLGLCAASLVWRRREASESEFV